MEIRPQPRPSLAGARRSKQLWRAPGDDVAVIPGTENHEPGNVRVSFLVADAEGAAVTLPTARVWVANALDARPFLETEAKLERIGVPGGDEADATHIYVATREAAARRQVLDARRARGRQHQGAGARERRRRRRRTRLPTSGIPRSRRRRRRSRRRAATRSKLTTRTPPDESLLRYSVADSLRAKAPFVVTFATPKFCSSRTCGPVVDVVEEVQRRFDDDACPLHPRRGVRGQRPGEGLQPLDEGVEAPDRAMDVPRERQGDDRRSLRGHGVGERARDGCTGEAGSRLSSASPRRSTTMFGTRAIGLSESTARTSATMSSGEICSSSGSPVHSVIRVATNPGEIAVARMPCSASSRFSEVVHAMSAAFVAP